MQEVEEYVDRTLEQQPLKGILEMEEQQNKAEKNAEERTNIVEEAPWRRVAVRGKIRR